jgi:protein ImuB
MGLREFGQLLRLPRAGLAERCGPALLEWMDHALGLRLPALARHVPAEHYRQRLELLEEVHGLPRLLALAQRQLAGLCGWLARRGLGLLEVRWRLSHAGGASTEMTLGLLEPARDPARLEGLLRERWHGLSLPGPVRAMELELRQSRPLAGQVQPLFRPASGAVDAGEVKRRRGDLVELLRARLGADAVHGLAPGAEHRPERAWQAADPGHAAAGEIEFEKKSSRSRFVLELGGTARPRPLWLLPEPRALAVGAGLPWFGGTLRPVTGAERIEAGWWEDAPIARDYHLAERADGLRCWVFRDLRAPGRWYLHGLFV